MFPGSDGTALLCDDDGTINDDRRECGGTTLTWNNATGRLTAGGALPTGQAIGPLVQVVAR